MLFLLSGLNAVQGQIVLNEVVSRNSESLRIKNESPDWIEIYNASDLAQSLDGYYLSDRSLNLKKWAFPSHISIPARAYFLIVCDPELNIENDSMVSCNFRIDSDGEQITLYREGMGIIQQTKLPRLGRDQSWSWNAQNSTYVVSNETTPWQVNNLLAIDQRSQIKISTRSDTVYSEAQVISYDIVEGNCDSIKYSVDGGSPQQLLLPGQPIRIKPEESLQPYFSWIPTRSNYRLPQTVHQFHHVRLQCFDQSQLGYSQDGQTFLMQKRFKSNLGVPSFFIDVAERDFFDADRGIYVEGNDRNFAQNGKEWKKPVSWAYGTADGLEANGSALAEIHGHATRELPQKSIKLTEVVSRGDQLLLPGLDTMLSSFVLRSFHSELVRWEFTDFGFRDDVVMHILADQKELYPQVGQFINLYVNGEYWGLHSLRPTSDEELVAFYEDIPTEDVTIQKGAQHVFNLYEKVKHLNLDNPDDFDEFTEWFDIDNLISYTLAEVWFNNRDWPFNNIKTWKLKDESGPYRFILFDTDATMKLPRKNPLAHFESDEIPSSSNPDHYLFFQFIMRSERIVDLLIDRYTEWQQTILDPKNTQGILHDLAQEIRPSLKSHIDRWHYPRSLAVWDKSQVDIKDFLHVRSLYFNNHLFEESNLHVFPNPARDNIRINLDLNLPFKYRWLALDGTLLSEWETVDADEIKISQQLKTGVYVLQIKTEWGKKAERVIIRR